MDDVYRLAAIEEIKQLKARYCRFADTKDWDGFRTVFTDDARIEFPDYEYSSENSEAFVENTKAGLSGSVSTMHHCHNAEIELIAEDEAVGTWAMEDRLEWSDGEHPSHHGYGHYHERYAKHGDEWLISALRLKYVKTETP